MSIIRDGSSWARAYLDLQKAIDRFDTSNPNAEIWISAGNVTPDWTNLSDEVQSTGWAKDLDDEQKANPRNWAFVLKGGVKVYGGFKGTETGRNDSRPWQTNKTTLSGALGSSGDAAHALIAAGISQATIVADLTVSGGNAIPPISNGALYANITINEEDIFEYYGGGVYTAGCERDLLFSRVTISGNRARYGGGMYNFESSPVLSAVVISNNTAPVNAVNMDSNSGAGCGGGMYNGYRVEDSVTPSPPYGCSPLLTNGTRVENNNSADGGGIYNRYAAPVLIGAFVTGNTALFGGGVSNADSVLTALNTEISRNTASAGGGGLNLRRAGALYSCLNLFNVLINGNTGGGVRFGDYSSDRTNLVNTEISGNTGSGIKYGANLHGSTVMTNVTISGNTATSGAGIYYATDGGAATHKTYNSIIWGNGSPSQNIYEGLSSTVDYDYSLVEGKGYTTDFGSTWTGPATGAIVSSYITDKGYNDYYPTVNDGSGSPAYAALNNMVTGGFITAATRDGILAALAKDFDENTRIQGGIIDLGAYEDE
jgi:hypothetical protein